MLGAVADDFTGATDLATMLRASGHNVVVTIEGSELNPEQLNHANAVVTALKTRTAPVDQAIERSRAALMRLQNWGATRFYMKYCSTFDSTDSGNIGPVLDTAIDFLGAQRCVVVPSMPANGRRVIDGLLYVGDVLLENSSMRHHPLTPMTRSRVADLLRPQTPHAVEEIHLPEVRRGSAQLRSTLDATPSPYSVIDAETEDDLRTIGAAVADDVVVSGGSGLALGIAGPTSFTDPWQPPQSQRKVVLCGSVSTRSLAQINHAARTQPIHVIDVQAAASNPVATVQAIITWIDSQDPQSIPVVCAATTRKDVVASSPKLDSAGTVEGVIASVAKELVDTGRCSTLIVAGGESSGAVVTTLGITSLRIGPVIAPGVCWSLTTGGSTPIALALKSGNFGAEDMFTHAWELLA